MICDKVAFAVGLFWFPSVGVSGCFLRWIVKSRYVRKGSGAVGGREGCGGRGLGFGWRGRIIERGCELERAGNGEWHRFGGD